MKRGGAPKPLVHGTITAYFTKGCRCQDCRDVARDYERNRAARTNPSPSLNRGPGRQPGQRGRCSKCGGEGHNHRTCRVTRISLALLLARQKPVRPHTHRYRFNEPNGPTVRGRCPCGRTQTAPASSYHLRNGNWRQPEA